MVRACLVVPAVALIGFRAACAPMQTRGYAMQWCDTVGATIYGRAGRTSHWRQARDEDVDTQPLSAAGDVAITWSGLVWARAPQPWPSQQRASLMAVYVQVVADRVVLPPSASWLRLMCAGGRGWLADLSRPVAHTSTLLLYTMGESVCTFAGPCPELVARAV